jgi:hypothetical protein
MPAFVPDDFDVPTELKTADFLIRPLLISDVVKGYDAVMTSADHLQGVFGPGRSWPYGLSFEQDLIDLGWHHKEFQRRRSFAYTVMTLDETECLGCLYINPTELPGYDAEVFCWVRARHAQALDARLYDALRAWIDTRWPFKAVAYPGRALPWETFAALGQAG